MRHCQYIPCLLLHRCLGCGIHSCCVVISVSLLAERHSRQDRGEGGEGSGNVLCPRPCMGGLAVVFHLLDLQPHD